MSSSAITMRSNLVSIFFSLSFILHSIGVAPSADDHRLIARDEFDLTFDTTNFPLKCYCTYPSCVDSGEFVCRGHSCFYHLLVVVFPFKAVPHYGCFTLERNMPKRQCTGRMRRTEVPGHLLSFTCCNSTNYCNKNITVSRHEKDIRRFQYPHGLPASLLPSSPSLLASPSPTISDEVIFPSSIIHQGVKIIIHTDTAITPGNEDKDVLYIMIISIVTVVVIVIILVIFVLLAFLIYKKIKKDSKEAKEAENEMRRDTTNKRTNSIIKTLNLVPCLNPENTYDITLSSSGHGATVLERRRFARDVNLKECIGSGRFGGIYIGIFNGHTYAIKRTFATQGDIINQEVGVFFKYRVSHENILLCSAMDYVCTDTTPEVWFMTEYHPRGSLMKVLIRETLSVKESLKVIISSCCGLSYLHCPVFALHGKPSIAHRDIKSGNILVKNDGSCCLADFGLSVDENSEYFNTLDITQGTNRYLSPEILSGTINRNKFDSFCRSDLYSFGLVIWEVCKRTKFDDVKECPPYEVPFETFVPTEPTFEQMRDIIVEKKIKPEVPPDWKENLYLDKLSKIMVDCLQDCPAQRPTSLNVHKVLSKLK